ncbi:hypothetical protein CQJ30_15990 [Caldibacillus thermoamylovorans]|uniref:hypothetical protein n=1 Tax=Caldibacillus thermoamylovorans TaxID=35841 RepID=UPI000D555055|nr:hypothetical protein [Caldibacillus thermoamylovorans]AWI13517.1 hypothetical protein CQJ30_15990 [Caldibacillus thermoamylovorans]
MFSIKQEMKKLAQKHPFFSSKEAFKNSFKHQLQEKFRVIENKDFHGCVVDLWVEDPNSEQQYAIYLMNKLAGLTIKQENQLIELKHHRAQDIGRYDFLKQVEKLEKITKGRNNIKGIAILLTNDHLYWNEPTRANTVDSYFRIHENRVLTGELKWLEHASAGTIKERENPIVIKGTYKLQWQHYSTVSNEKHGEFCYLAVHVGEDR